MNPWQPGEQPGPEQHGTPQGPGGVPPHHPGAPTPPAYPYSYPAHQPSPYPQPGQAPGYSPYSPYPQPQYGGPAPSAGTAIAAAILSFLGALANALGALGNFAVPTMAQFHGSGTGVFVVLGMVSLAITVALLVGGILLLRRKLAGRLIIAVTCGVVIAMALIGYLMAQSLLNQAGVSAAETMPTLLGRTIGSIFFPALTMVLALVPSTKKWCLAGGRPGGW